MKGRDHLADPGTVKKDVRKMPRNGVQWWAFVKTFMNI